MRTLDRFANVAGEALGDPDVLRLGTVLLRGGGRSLARANPVVVWVEAGIAVGEACASYFRYARELEVGKRLQAQCARWDAMLQDALAANAMTLKQAREQARNNTLRLELTARQQQRELALSADKVRAALALLRDMQAVLREERSRSGTLGEIVELQLAVDVCTDATLQLILNPGGKTP